jgi:hypothetical protein
MPNCLASVARYRLFGLSPLARKKRDRGDRRAVSAN